MTCPLSCSGAVETKVTARELHTALRAYSDLHVSCCDAIAKAYLNHTLAVEARVAAAAAAAAAAASSGDAVDEQAGGVVGRLPSIGTLVQVRAGGRGCALRDVTRVGLSAVLSRLFSLSSVHLAHETE